MSVLSFPRVYFTGYMGWDPPTANNNDYLPTNDAAIVDLDWDYLASQGIQKPTTEQEWMNLQSIFNPWAVKPHQDSCPAPDLSDTCNSCTDPTSEDEFCHMGGRWAFNGTGGSWLNQYAPNGKVSVIAGGDVLDDGKIVSQEGDPAIGQPVAISGNTFGGRDSPARLVDVNPLCPWSSQVFYGGFELGGGDTFIKGTNANSVRMHSRFFYVPRTLPLPDPPLSDEAASDVSKQPIITYPVGVIFQAAIPWSALSVEAGDSRLLGDLAQAMQAPGAQGLMVRFSTYRTLYYQNGIYNDVPEQPRSCEELSKMLLEGKVFMNPAYSRVVGTFGVWNDGELANAPGGFLLSAQNTVVPVSTGTKKAATSAATPGEQQSAARGMPVKPLLVKEMRGHGGPTFLDAALSSEATAQKFPPLPFGPILAEVDAANTRVSLDLLNTVPEVHAADNIEDLSKVDYGPMTVGFANPDRSDFVPLTEEIPYTDYDQTAYDQRGGLVDVDFLASVDAGTVQGNLSGGDSLLALQVGGHVVALERALTAWTDQRGVYVDQCKMAEVSVQVRYRNGAPPAGTRLKLVEYYPWRLKVGAGAWQRTGTTPDTSADTSSDQPICDVLPTGPYLSFVDGDTVDVTVTDGADYGEATVRFTSLQPGFPSVAFYPLMPGQDTPNPPVQDTVGFSLPTDSAGTTDYAGYNFGNVYYTTVRNLPFDNDLVSDFVDCWNAAGKYAGQPKHDRQQIWQFIYSNILFYYDLLYPAMLPVLPLGELIRVEGAIDQLVTMIQENWVDQSTLYMPVTRELSAAKRLILLTWGNLVQRRYPQEDLPQMAVPCDAIPG